MLALACGLLAEPRQQPAAPIGVRHVEGLVHGFLLLRAPEGEAIASGELTQTASGNRVTINLVFHFKDGSLNEEKVIYSQLQRIRLQSYHLTQKGPAFKHPIELTVNGVSGDSTVHYTDDDGKQKEASAHFDLPPNIANGLIPTMLKNVPPGMTQVTLSMVAATPKPRLVNLVISPAGQDSFSIGTSSREAMKYVVKVQIGGVAGVVAPLVGKQPPDSYVWILGGDAPTFVKSEGPLYEGGPVWRIELASPTGP
jgi:hypothetical protein